MAKDKIEKTNVMRVLDQKKIEYSSYSYEGTDAISGVEVAGALGQDPASVFKTLVTTGKTGEHYVFMIPVAEELDLKKMCIRDRYRPLQPLPTIKTSVFILNSLFFG